MRKTLQDRNREATQKREKRVSRHTLFIPLRNSDEREYLRSRVWYTGASLTYIATTMTVLPLAASVLMQCRGTKTVVVRRKGRDFWLDTPTSTKQRT